MYISPHSLHIFTFQHIKYSNYLLNFISQGSPLFAIRQRRVSTENTEGTIFLVGPLDFEAQSMYHLTLLAVVRNNLRLIVV